MTRRGWLLATGAGGVLISAYVHFYLYFEDGYRGVHIDRVAGLDISRSFALNAIAGLVIAEALMIAIRLPRLATPAALVGIVFSLAALIGYLLSRTVGLLGFTEHETTLIAVISKLAELIAIGALALSLRRPAVSPAD